MFLGNIVTQTDLKDHKLFKIVDSLEEIDNELPTLIIGWEFTKLLYGDNKPSILDKEITDNISWTFNKKERRVDYESDFITFFNKCISSINNRVPYTYINILTIEKYIIKKLIKNLISDNIFHIYIKNNSFIYIYDGYKIIGLDFNIIDFLKIDRKKIYRILYSNKNDVFFNTDFLEKEPKQNVQLNNRVIPYLKKISND